MLRELTLPYHEDSPAIPLQLPRDPRISLAIALELGKPKIIARFWNAAQRALVPMPKTSVDKNDLASPSENEIRLSRQPAYVRTVTVAECRDDSPNRQLGLGALAADEAHSRTALYGRQSIHGLPLPSRRFEAGDGTLRFSCLDQKQGNGASRDPGKAPVALFGETFQEIPVVLGERNAHPSRVDFHL